MKADTTKYFGKLVLAAIMGVGVIAPGASSGQENYPNRAVTIVVPYAAGGSSDVLARIAAGLLQRELGQPFIVENRTGAGGLIGTAAVAKAVADGYTLLHANSAFAVAPYTAKITYDAERDFDAVAVFAITNFAIVVSPQLNVRDLREFIARAKESPGKLTYGSSGVGSTTHLFGELFQSAANVKLLHIPYKGSAPGLLDVSAGRVSMYVGDIATSSPYIRAGKLKPLAVTSLSRDHQLPDVPTAADTIPGFEAVGWQGLLARSGTPKEAIDRLNHALNTGLKRPEVAANFDKIGVGVRISTPAASNQFVRLQLRTFKKVVADAGIVPE